MLRLTFGVSCLCYHVSALTRMYGVGDPYRLVVAPIEQIYSGIRDRNVQLQFVAENEALADAIEDWTYNEDDNTLIIRSLLEDINPQQYQYNCLHAASSSTVHMQACSSSVDPRQRWFYDPDTGTIESAMYERFCFASRRNVREPFVLAHCESPLEYAMSFNFGFTDYERHLSFSLAFAGNSSSDSHSYQYLVPDLENPQNAERSIFPSIISSESMLHEYTPNNRLRVSGTALCLYTMRSLIRYADCYGAESYENSVFDPIVISRYIRFRNNANVCLTHLGVTGPCDSSDSAIATPKQNVFNNRGILPNGVYTISTVATRSFVHLEPQKAEISMGATPGLRLHSHWSLKLINDQYTMDSFVRKGHSVFVGHRPLTLNMMSVEAGSIIENPAKFSFTRQPNYHMSVVLTDCNRVGGIAHMPQDNKFAFALREPEIMRVTQQRMKWIPNGSIVEMFWSAPIYCLSSTLEVSPDCASWKLSFDKYTNLYRFESTTGAGCIIPNGKPDNLAEIGPCDGDSFIFGLHKHEDLPNTYALYVDHPTKTDLYAGLSLFSVGGLLQFSEGYENSIFFNLQYV